MSEFLIDLMNSFLPMVRNNFENPLAWVTVAVVILNLVVIFIKRWPKTETSEIYRELHNVLADAERRTTELVTLLGTDFNASFRVIFPQDNNLPKDGNEWKAMMHFEGVNRFRKFEIHKNGNFLCNYLLTRRERKRLWRQAKRVYQLALAERNKRDNDAREVEKKEVVAYLRNAR